MPPHQVLSYLYRIVIHLRMTACIIALGAVGLLSDPKRDAETAGWGVTVTRNLSRIADSTKKSIFIAATDAFGMNRKETVKPGAERSPYSSIWGRRSDYGSEAQMLGWNFSCAELGLPFVFIWIFTISGMNKNQTTQPLFFRSSIRLLKTSIIFRYNSIPRT